MASSSARCSNRRARWAAISTASARRRRDRLVVFLGDVSGKGIPASMFMVRAISLARLLARDIAEPERILARLNDELAADNPSGMFVTFLCAVFDPGSGRLTLANAGHCRPVLLPRRRTAALGGSAISAPRWASSPASNSSARN